MANVQMPRLSDSMETGKVLRWLKQEGEEVKKGEPLVEIESDKANIEVEAYASGKLSKIVVKEGESAPIGAVIAEIGGEGEAAAASKPAPSSQGEAKAGAESKAPASGQAETTQSKSPGTGTAEKPKPVAQDARAQVKQAEKAAAAEGGEQYPQGGPDDRTEAGAAAQAALRTFRRPSEDGEKVKASPVARRLAEELGVELSRVEGSGPGGRITKEDVEAAAEKQGAQPARAQAPARPQARPTEAEPAAQEGQRGAQRPKEEVEVVELSKMQTTVAMRLAQSKFSAPHFYVTSEIDMADALHLRQSFNETVDKAESLSINDLVVKAAAMALTKFPEVNASWADGRIERKRDINIGIAVNLPDGLIVPVLRNVDKLPLKDVALQAKSLIERARTKKARPEDYQGNTFTVSNLGMYDVDQFTAIINPPDSGILAVGAVLDKPVVKDGQVVPGKRMRVTLSVDHRVFYGVAAAQFLQEIKRLLEHPVALVL